MQKTVFGDEEKTKDETFSKKVHGAAIMYRHLPTAEEINDRNDICEQQHKDCNLNEWNCRADAVLIYFFQDCRYH